MHNSIDLDNKVNGFFCEHKKFQKTPAETLGSL